MAIALGISCVFLFGYNGPYEEWLETNYFGIESPMGTLFSLYYQINPSFVAMRSLAIIFYWINENGSFTWSDISSAVPIFAGTVEGYVATIFILIICVMQCTHGIDIRITSNLPLYPSSSSIVWLGTMPIIVCAIKSIGSLYIPHSGMPRQRL